MSCAWSEDRHRRAPAFGQHALGSHGGQGGAWNQYRDVRPETAGEGNSGWTAFVLPVVAEWRDEDNKKNSGVRRETAQMVQGAVGTQDTQKFGNGLRITKAQKRETRSRRRAGVGPGG